MRGPAVVLRRLLAHAGQQQFRRGHRLDVRGDRHRQAEHLTEHRTHRSSLPAQFRMVDDTGAGIDPAADGDTHP